LLRVVAGVVGEDNGSERSDLQDDEPDRSRGSATHRERCWELASLEYPRVWIGQEGMTADELLNLQMDNEELPEWMRVDPGELVQVEGDEGGGGLQVPEVSHRWLDGLWVYENMLHALPGHELAELEMEVLHIFAAKQDKVPVGTLLEAAPIGGQLFAHDTSRRDCTGFRLPLDAYATRLLAQALNWRDTNESRFFMERGENKHREEKRDTLAKGGYRGAEEAHVPSPLLTC
jgi:hypothetical protein